MLVYHKSWGGYSDSTAYMNNIFYAEGAGATFNLEKSTQNIFTSNTYYGDILNTPSDPLASRQNPLFRGEIPSAVNWKTYLKFMLQDHSPAINQGVEIPGQPSEDFLGKPITGKPDRGVFETNIKDTGISSNLYLYPVFEKVEIKKDILFGESIDFDGKPVKLRLDVYSPDGDSLTDRPVILWMHGGGFRPGNDKSQSYIVRMANEFARRGYVCISLDYRVRANPGEDKKGTLSDALEDAMKGLEWIRENSESLKIDKNKIFVGGGSAGGRLATNLCYKDGDADHPWDKSGIIGLVNLWGSPDDTWTLYETDPADPPTIIVHGTADELVPYKNSEILVRELQKNRIRHELVTLEGAGHTPSGHMDTFIPRIAAFLVSLLQE
jgi:acetyl esterase/lipase